MTNAEENEPLCCTLKPVRIGAMEPAHRPCSVGPPRSAIPGRVAANPASCRVTHYAKPALGQQGLMGPLTSRSQARSRARSTAGRAACEAAAGCDLLIWLLPLLLPLLLLWLLICPPLREAEWRFCVVGVPAWMPGEPRWAKDGPWRRAHGAGPERRPYAVGEAFLGTFVAV